MCIVLSCRLLRLLRACLVVLSLGLPLCVPLLALLPPTLHVLVLLFLSLSTSLFSPPPTHPHPPSLPPSLLLFFFISPSFSLFLLPSLSLFLSHTRVASLPPAICVLSARLPLNVWSSPSHRPVHLHLHPRSVSPPGPSPIPGTDFSGRSF